MSGRAEKGAQRVSLKSVANFAMSFAIASRARVPSSTNSVYSPRGSKATVPIRPARDADRRQARPFTAPRFESPVLPYDVRRQSQSLTRHCSIPADAIRSRSRLGERDRGLFERRYD